MRRKIMFSKVEDKRLHARRRWTTAAALALVLTLGLTAIASALSAGNVDGVWGNPTPSSPSSFRWCYAPDNTTGSAARRLAAAPPVRAFRIPPAVRRLTKTSGGMEILPLLQLRMGFEAATVSTATTTSARLPLMSRSTLADLHTTTILSLQILFSPGSV